MEDGALENLIIGMVRRSNNADNPINYSSKDDCIVRQSSLTSGNPSSLADHVESFSPAPPHHGDAYLLYYARLFLCLGLCAWNCPLTLISNPSISNQLPTCPVGLN